MVNIWLIAVAGHNALSFPLGCCPFQLAIAMRPLGMFFSTLVGTLVVLVGLALLAATSLPRALWRAVDVAAVTMAANGRQTAAVRARTHIETTRYNTGAIAASAMWTRPAIGDIMPVHSCPARIGGTAPKETWWFCIGAVPVSNDSRFLSHQFAPKQHSTRAVAA